ncbi:hypothetical protein DH2020_027060 [Rehmannia glutinosa]|uniref:Uncharacterized protein n=1 Tax=Rehmannia glutinosa TaxID=99300 RepID=A0ABR0VZ04_REHGL
MEDNNSKQPLLSSIDEEQVPQLSGQRYFIQHLSNHSFTSSFVADGDDIAQSPALTASSRRSTVESKSYGIWRAPLIFTSVCQYSLGAITQTFAATSAHSNSPLSPSRTQSSPFKFWRHGIDSIASPIQYKKENVPFRFALVAAQFFTTILRNLMATDQTEKMTPSPAIETNFTTPPSRSWVILLATSFLLTLIYVFAEPILLVLAQDKDISRVAARYSLWMISQLYAYAMNFPIAKFLQAQSKIMAMAWISAVALVLHVFFSWLFMLRLGWGMAGGAWVLNLSWWFIVVGQLVYIFSGTCGRAWSGFSWRAFQNLWGFVKLSMASAVMLW